jgi:putative RecB family exonuclease
VASSSPERTVSASVEPSTHHADGAVVASAPVAVEVDAGLHPDPGVAPGTTVEALSPGEPEPAVPAPGPLDSIPDDHHRVASLSPSRATDFMTCPLLYRFRVIDRLPQRPSRAATRGTLVHAVLETLFDLPSDQRTLPRAAGLLPAALQRLLEQDESLQDLFEDEAEPESDAQSEIDVEVAGQSAAAGIEAGAPGPPTSAGAAQTSVSSTDEATGASSPEPGSISPPVAAFLAEAEDLLGRYFTLEDPSRLEPAERELLVSTPLPSGLLLRGIVDRIDVAPGGQVRVVDYKTGQAPSEVFEAKALFQMKFYALVLWRLRGTIPAMLQLVYLGGEGTLMRYQPEERDLLATERKLDALWQAIERSYERREFLPSPSRLCSWCDHHALCPAFDGTPPPLPDPLPVPAMESVAELADGPD